MAGFWERYLDKMYSAPEDKARHSLANRQRAQAKRISAQAERVRQIRQNLRDLDAAHARIADLEDQVDRLTRCLLAHEVIEQADLDAILPRSDVQDTPSYTPTSERR